MYYRVNFISLYENYVFIQETGSKKLTDKVYTLSVNQQFI